MSIRAAAIGLISCSIALGFGYFQGIKQGLFLSALSENNLATANLHDSHKTLPPEFREYLKARIYYNVYMHYPSSSGYLQQKDWDFGPVNRSLLGDIISVKDPTIQISDWTTAISQK